MTQYAGEEFLITAELAVEGGGPLTDSIGVRVAVSVYDPAGETVVSDATMTYDPVAGWWAYAWNTVNLPATGGTYRAKVTVTGADLGVSIETTRVRLARDPVRTA